MASQFLSPRDPLYGFTWSEISKQETYLLVYFITIPIPYHYIGNYFDSKLLKLRSFTKISQLLIFLYFSSLWFILAWYIDFSEGYFPFPYCTQIRLAFCYLAFILVFICLIELSFSGPSCIELTSHPLLLNVNIFIRSPSIRLFILE